MSEYTLSNPVLELTFNQKPSKKFVAAFALVSVVAFGALGYFYVVVLPQMFGFETAVLIGLLVLMYNNQ